MNAKEILQKIKAVFEAPLPPTLPAPEPTELSPCVECTLPDGRIMVCTPSCEVGATCTIDGQPAPDGVYECTIEDGSTCTCTVANGICTDVQMPQPVTAEVPPTPSFEERLAALEASIAELKKCTPQMSQVEATQTQLQEAEARMSKQDEVIEGLFELAEKLAETPTAEPTTLNGNRKQKFERTLAREEKIEGIANAITQLKHK